MNYEFMDPESEKQKLWEEARQWAVAEILAKYHKELKEAHSRQFSRLTKRATDGLSRPHYHEFVDGVCWCGEKATSTSSRH